MTRCVYCGEIIEFRYVNDRAVPIGHTCAGAKTPDNYYSGSNIFYSQNFSNAGSLCNPTNCPECGDKVFFVRHNGGSVWLDPPLGPPWKKHPCFIDDKGNYALDLLLPNDDETNEWSLGLVINTKVSREEDDYFEKYTDLIIETNFKKPISARVSGNAAILLGNLIILSYDKNIIKCATRRRKSNEYYKPDVFKYKYIERTKNKEQRNKSHDIQKYPYHPG